jgi:UDP-glucose 4-epimerase
MEHAKDKINIFNLGTDEYCEVNNSIAWLCEHLNLSPTIAYEGGERGWIGDNPFIFLDCKKIRELGWKPKLSIKEGIIKTIAYLQSNQDMLELRA